LKLGRPRRRAQTLRPAERYLTLGAEEARRAGHAFVGIEHVLRGLGISSVDAERPPPRIDPEALRTLGIDFDEVRAQLDETFGPGALERTRAACLGVSPQLKRALAHAVDLADGGPVTDVHVLLGILSVR
jgi:ATP-dependent Clp protease ATP-binding subunit ClpA